MDAADAPAESTIEERRPKGTPEEQLAALGADTAEAAEPEKPEQDMEAGAASSASNNATTLDNRPQPSISPANTTQPSRETSPDSAAAPVSPPASDRNATAAVRANTSPPQQPPTVPETKPQSQISSPRTQISQDNDQRPQGTGTAPINAAAMAVGVLASAVRRPETQSQPATPAAPATPPPSAPSSLLNRFAVRNILETLRGPQDQALAAPASAPLSQGTSGSPASPASTTAAAPPGGLQDKLTTFTTERMQPRREAERVQGATQAATGALASLQALEQQETTGILTKIRDAAKANGGMETVLSEMRPGGQFEDLRKAFNTVLSHDEGFAAAYDKATGAIADYAEIRAALPPPSTMRSDPNLARLQTLDHEIAEAAKTLPGIKDGQSAFEDLAQSGREAVQELFSAVQQAFNPNADLRGPSPSPGFGR
jgi:hypothetical protein